MKTNKLFIGLLLTMSMLFTACVDIEVTTLLNANGSIDRIVEVNSDSELKNYDDLPFPIDSSWQIDYTLDTTIKSKKHKYVFKKHYKSADELNSDYETIPGGLSKFNRKVIVNKKFRWFYTYITYEEKYEKLAKGNYRPFNQYLSDIEKEVRKLENGDSTDNFTNLDKKKIDRYAKDIDKKFEKWFEDNLKEEVMYAIEQDLIDNGVQGINSKELRARTDTIYEILDSSNAQDMKHSLYESLNQIFNTDEFNKVIDKENTELEKFEKILEYIIGQEGFKYNLQMPGLLLDANAEIIKGNRLTWQFEPIESFFIETSQTAESRIVNLWAFWISGIFVVLVLILLFLPVFKRTK